MRRTTKRTILTLLLVTVLTMSISFDSLAATTVGDLIGDSAVDDTQDPVRLINLALLRDVDITKITYRDKTIIDTLTQDEKNSHSFSNTTIMVYSEAMGNARTGLQNGWSVNNIIDYADEAYDLYDDNIAKLATESLTAKDVEEAIYKYIENNVESQIDVGNLEETLPLLVSEYTLQSIVIDKITNKIEIDTNIGELMIDDASYHCSKTTWYTNNVAVKALLNGTVCDITPTSLSTSIGGEQHRLVIKYQSDKPIELLDESIKVGTHVIQGADLLNGENTHLTITITYNDSHNVDLLSLLGATGKILVNEYQRIQAEPFDENREIYISHYLKLYDTP